MKLRTRVTVAVTIAMLVPVIGVSMFNYVSTSRELHGQVDHTLIEQGDRLAAIRELDTRPFPTIESSTSAIPRLFTDSYLQLLDRDGHVIESVGQGPLPLTQVSEARAAASSGAAFESLTIAGQNFRVYNLSTDWGAFRFGRSLAEIDSSLDRMLMRRVVGGTAAVLLAATMSWFMVARAISPVQRLSDTARNIKDTRDLTQRLPVQGHDEVASMANSFNELLIELDRSQTMQRQLVADASHELRTPMTTLRTNIEVLASGHDLPASERAQIMTDLTDQLEDLTILVGDLVDLARDEATETPPEAVQLDEIVSEVVDRARRQRPTLTFTLDQRPSLVTASPDRLDRAVSNLVDNAAKWSPPEGEVRIRVEEGTVSVADDGPGIHPDDLERIFDRFYRSPASRQMPGSGLGLAIVKRFAETSGGSVKAVSSPGQGTTVHLTIPTSEPVALAEQVVPA